jgi:hypothetical protein
MTLNHRRSLAVDDPEIDEVLDLDTGEILPAQIAIGDDYEIALQLRMALRDGIAAEKPLFACPLCAVPVHMVSLRSERRFYFRHETEDGRCPAKTKGRLSEERILAMKYDGARESAAHIRMKEIIAESLERDSDFSHIEVEPIWKGAERNERRRPDVRATWRRTLPVAFEIQLSTTFLRVIAERRQFYLREGGLLLWVFKKFDMGDSRLTQDDIFYNNNRNAFVASEETLKASREAGGMVLNCIWSEPSNDEGQLVWTPKSGLAAFRDLTLHQEKQRVFLFDADRAKEQCLADTRDGPLRRDFRKLWLSASAHDDAAWVSLRSRFAERGITLPRYPGAVKGFRELLDTLYTASEGTPVGWRHADVVKVAQHVFDKYKGQLWAFKLLLAAHDRGDLIRAHDETRNWRDKKVRAYRAAWESGIPTSPPTDVSTT